jgi:hypothetical protein
MNSGCRPGGLVLLLFLALTAQRAAVGNVAGMIDRRLLEPELSAFTEGISPCAVLVMKTDSGEIIYAHNRTALFESRYPVGSIMKPLSALVLLDNREVLGFDESKSVHCAGRYYPGGRLSFVDADERIFNLPRDERKVKYFRCSQRDGDVEVHLDRAITLSCNTYFLAMASVNPRPSSICWSTPSASMRTAGLCWRDAGRYPPRWTGPEPPLFSLPPLP